MSAALRLKLSIPAALALAVFTCGGCGESQATVVPVKGQVTFDGQPFGPINLLLVPKGPDKAKAKQGSAAVDDKGNATFSSYANGDGLPPGEYQVVVVPPPAGSGKIPKVYLSEQESPLSVKVADKDASVKIDMVSSAGPPQSFGGSAIKGAMDPAAMLKNSMPSTTSP